MAEECELWIVDRREWGPSRCREAKEKENDKDGGPSKEKRDFWGTLKDICEFLDRGHTQYTTHTTSVQLKISNPRGGGEVRAKTTN